MVKDKWWKAAAELKAGDILETADGKCKVVKSITVEEKGYPVTTYNLSVEDNHTFFVGKLGVLTHNMKGFTPCELADEVAEKATKGVSNPLKEIEFSKKQVGKKWGEHMKDYPELKSYGEYKDFAQDVFNNPEKIFYDKFEDEYLYVRGKDLLRTKPDGSFVSIYPGADSARVTKVIERGGKLIWPQ